MEPLPKPGAIPTADILNEAFEAALRGDSQALEVLLSLLKTRYGNLIYARLRRHRGAAHTATMEDIFQQSMLDFMEQIKSGALADLEESERKNVVLYFQGMCDDRLEWMRRERKGPLLKRQKEELQDSLLENRRIPQSSPDPGEAAKVDERRELLHREIDALAPFDRLVFDRYFARVPYSEISKETGKKVSTLESLVTRIKQKLEERILLQSPTARIVQERKKAPRQESSCVPTRDEILGALRQLPIEAQAAIDFVHVKGGSVEEFARTLGDRGLEKAQARLGLGYESLSRKLDLPFPESFDFLDS